MAAASKATYFDLHDKAPITPAQTEVVTHVPTAGKSLAFIGNSRQAMWRSNADVRCRGFSITRLEGSRWPFAADAVRLWRKYEDTDWCGHGKIRAKDRKTFGER